MRKRSRANPGTGWVSVYAGICFATHESLSFGRAETAQLTKLPDSRGEPSEPLVVLARRASAMAGQRRVELHGRNDMSRGLADGTSYSVGLPCAMLLLLISMSATLAFFASTVQMMV